MSEEFLDKDVEILRLIEERRSIPKEEKQRIKGSEQAHKKCTREKKRMKRQQDIQRILEEFKGVRNIPRIKSAKKKVFTTKKRTTEENASHLEKELPTSLVNFDKRLYEDNEKEMTLNMK